MQLIGKVLEMVGSLFGSKECRPTPPECDCPPQCPPSGPDCPPSSDPSCPPSEPNCPPSGPNCPPEKTGKAWDVFFDSKQGTKTKQRSPIVLDLNGNGQADITGSNIKGNGKLEGKTVKGFDLDPTARQWETKSVQRRPGKGAPELPKGTTMTVFDANGKQIATRSADELKGAGKGKDKSYGVKGDQRAEFRDAEGRLVGELKRDEKSGKQMYFFGNKNENEWTKPWEGSKGGDGMLVWDHDNDGQITSGKELFGEFDVDGKKKFSNGYEKLAAHFDKNKDGTVNGSELQGLKIWEDRNGDGITQKGELVELSKHGVTSLSTRFKSEDMSSTYGKR
jgi:hypothetical protein